MSNIDSQVINKFLESDEQSPVVDRQTVYITDSNSGSYTNNIIFNCQALGTCSPDQWYSFNEGYLQIPYIVNIKASALPTSNFGENVIRDYISFKDGYYNILDTISVEQNGVNIQQISNFNNVYTHFKKLSTEDINTINKNFPTLGVCTDTVTGIAYEASGAGHAPINTYYNNKVDGTTIFDNSIKKRNRILVNSDDATYIKNSSTINSIINAGNTYYVASGAANNVNTIHSFVFMAVIKLADISDYFSQMPLSKSNDIRLNITYNSTKLDLTYATDGNLSSATVNQITGNTCAFTCSTLSLPSAAGTVLTIKSNVVSIDNISAGQPVTQCRLYVPQYTINSATSQKMISMKPTTNIRYSDSYTYQIINRTAGNSVVETITTGIKSPKFILVIPYVHTTPTSQFINPFNTTPMTSSNVILDNFQVTVSGQNMFRENIKYDYFEFMECVSKIFGYDGNNNPQISSGAIDQYMWANGYRCYITDLSRTDRNVTHSIVVSFTNAGLFPITCLVFLAYERNINIKTSTGEIS
jgi:hypothetical protein